MAGPVASYIGAEWALWFWIEVASENFPARKVCMRRGICGVVKASVSDVDQETLGVQI
jgi:hypothetical protein